LSGSVKNEWLKAIFNWYKAEAGYDRKNLRCVGRFHPTRQSHITKHGVALDGASSLTCILHPAVGVPGTFSRISQVGKTTDFHAFAPLPTLF
jgi:hypothetical protein